VRACLHLSKSHCACLQSARWHVLWRDKSDEAIFLETKRYQSKSHPFLAFIALAELGHAWLSPRYSVALDRKREHISLECGGERGNGNRYFETGHAESNEDNITSSSSEGRKQGSTETNHDMWFPHEKRWSMWIRSFQCRIIGPDCNLFLFLPIPPPIMQLCQARGWVFNSVSLCQSRHFAQYCLNVLLSSALSHPDLSNAIFLLVHNAMKGSFPGYPGLWAWCVRRAAYSARPRWQKRRRSRRAQALLLPSSNCLRLDGLSRAFVSAESELQH
jgi:hypothetical protein